jgi:type II secretory pathway component PulF
MNALLDRFQSDPLEAVLWLIFLFASYLIAGLLPVSGIIYVIYFVLTLPMRRAERARVFLDLLELGLKKGRTPEHAIVGASASQDRSLGIRFHLVAAYLREGLRLSEALERVPRLVPPQLRAMLKTGERIGDVKKVLPACRQILKDSVSHVRGALNYVVVLAFVVTPFAVFVPLVLRVKVLPSFKSIFEGMFDGMALPAFTRLVFADYGIFTAIQIAILCLVWLAVFAHAGGPRVLGWTQCLADGLPDWILTRLPWRRKRLQRDFSAMLAILLDAEVAEAEAVTLAAEATANRVFIRRAEKVRALLGRGVKLPEAISAMDDSGELKWRLANALHRGGGFLHALAGWHEALDAKAFQLEQAAAQTTTTALVLLNGAMVGSIVLAVFLALIELLNHATLW